MLPLAGKLLGMLSDVQTLTPVSAETSLQREASALLAQRLGAERPNVVWLIASWFIAMVCCDQLVVRPVVSRCFPGRDKDSYVRLREMTMSLLHSVLAMPLVVWMALHVEHPAMKPSLSHVPFFYIDHSGAIFTGYLLWAGTNLFINRRVFANEFVTQLMHHGVFLSMIALNKHTLWLNYAFAVLYLGEMSTIFLNIRLFYRELKCEETWASALFALSFFFTRIVVFGLLLGHIFRMRGDLCVLLSWSLRISYFGCLPAAFALNFFWFTKIAKTAMKVASQQAAPVPRKRS